MKLYENSTHILEAVAKADCNYITYVKCNGFIQEVGRSWNLSKKVTKYFSANDLMHIRAKLHTIKYVNSRFK